MVESFPFDSRMLAQSQTVGELDAAGACRRARSIQQYLAGPTPLPLLPGPVRPESSIIFDAPRGCALDPATGSNVGRQRTNKHIVLLL
jgi:hypothetical protein